MSTYYDIMCKGCNLKFEVAVALLEVQYLISEIQSVVTEDEQPALKRYHILKLCLIWFICLSSS